MSIVESPPKINELIESHRSALFDIYSKNLVPDEKGRYLHWDKVKRLYSNREDAEKVWLKIKMLRQATLRAITQLKNKDEECFYLSIPDNCNATIHTIEMLHTKLHDLSSQYSNNHEYLINSLTMEEAISSSQLEGAATTRKVAKEMLEQERSPKNSDERMIVNNYLLMNLTDRHRFEPLTIELICQFHRRATNGIDHEKVKPGCIRETDDIYISNRDGAEPLYIPPYSKDLKKRLSDLCEFANFSHDGLEGRKFIHPVVKAIILHFMIGYEHPFHDGNGRTARALFYWFMFKHKYNDFKYISISKLLKEAPVQYAKSYLYTETDDNDLTYFIDYQLKIISRSIDELFGHLNKKTKELYEVMSWLQETKLFKDGKLNPREIIILKKALKDPGRMFTAKEIKNDLGITENTARSYLNKLSELGLLFKSTRYNGRHVYVSVRDIIDVLKGHS